MAQKSQGSRHGTRHKFAKNSDDTLTVNDRMKELEEGEKVLIDYHPSVQDGRQHHRFQGATAKVTGFRGDALELEIKDGKKNKQLYLKPVHVSKIGEE